MATVRTDELVLTDGEVEALKAAAARLPGNWVVQVRRPEPSFSETPARFEVVARGPHEVHMRGFASTGKRCIADARAYVEEVARQVNARDQ